MFLNPAYLSAPAEYSVRTYVAPFPYARLASRLSAVTVGVVQRREQNKSNSARRPAGVLLIHSDDDITRRPPMQLLIPPV